MDERKTRGPRALESKLPLSLHPEREILSVTSQRGLVSHGVLLDSGKEIRYTAPSMEHSSGMLVIYVDGGVQEVRRYIIKSSILRHLV